MKFYADSCDIYYIVAGIIYSGSRTIYINIDFENVNCDIILILEYWVIYYYKYIVIITLRFYISYDKRAKTDVLIIFY